MNEKDKIQLKIPEPETEDSQEFDLEDIMKERYKDYAYAGLITEVKREKNKDLAIKYGNYCQRIGMYIGISIVIIYIFISKYIFMAFFREKEIVEIDWDPEMAEKGGFDHFMLKEIYEEPQVIKDTLSESPKIKEIVMENNPKYYIVEASALPKYF